MLAAAVLVNTAVAAVQAAGLSVILVAVSSPVAPYGDARVQIRTSPGATCSITVRYKSGPSKAQGCEQRGQRAELRTSFEVR